MRPSLKALRSRASERARRAAEGAGPPAGQEPPRPEQASSPGAVERGTMRRRLRRARRMRETLMTELGALVMEMHRQGRHDPALVDRKAREALVTDREAAGLARALGAGQGVREVVAAGIAGGCRACGGLLATDDRFCARCGTATAVALNGAAAVAPQPAAPAPAAISAPPPDPRTQASLPPPDPHTQAPAPVLPPGPAAQLPPPPASAAVPAPPPDPRTQAPAPPPDPRTQAPAPPPDPATRTSAPGAAPAPGPPPDAPPPPDPRTRVPAAGEEADTARIPTVTPRD